MIAKILATIIVWLTLACLITLWLSSKNKRWELVVVILSGFIATGLVLLMLVAIWE